jgi:hypothetical protein
MADVDSFLPFLDFVAAGDGRAYVRGISGVDHWFQLEA